MFQRMWFSIFSIAGACSAGMLVAPIVDNTPSASAGEDGAPTTYRYLGAGSCASAACHNGQGPKGDAGSEYTTWAAYDAHASAYAVLYSPRSRRISANLQRAMPATKDPSCLKCHVTPEYGDAIAFTVRDPATFLSDGVSCESCHGAALSYVSEHYKTGWKGLSAAQKLSHGMNDLKSLGKRIELCAKCHIGTKDSDVNHDLIAAGHPRLAFEFSSYHGTWQRHWPDRLDHDPQYGGDTDFEIRAWALGQAMCAKAALELLQARAAGAVETKKPWPEFAEYDCFACHHDLHQKSWRQRIGEKGTVPWSAWQRSQLLQTIPIAMNGREKLQADLSALVQLMENGFGREPQEAARLAAIAGKSLNDLIEPMRRQNWLTLAHAVARMSRDGEKGNWDVTAQSYLALTAATQTLERHGKNELAGSLQEELAKMRETLRFPANYDSPKNYMGRILDGR